MIMSDDFARIILQRADGTELVIELGGDVRYVEKSFSIDRHYGRTVMSLTLRMDTQHVRTQPTAPNAPVLELPPPSTEKT